VVSSNGGPTGVLKPDLNATLGSHRNVAPEETFTAKCIESEKMKIFDYYITL